MVAFHHVNLGVPADGIEAESAFLCDVLGYRRMELSEDMARLGAHWHQAADGTEVHLSADADHRPAARAHTAVSFGTQLPEIAHRLKQAGIDYSEVGRPGLPPTLICRDPAGNMWELRGDEGAAVR